MHIQQQRSRDYDWSNQRQAPAAYINVHSSVVSGTAAVLRVVVGMEVLRPAQLPLPTAVT